MRFFHPPNQQQQQQVDDNEGGNFKLANLNQPENSELKNNIIIKVHPAGTLKSLYL
jgi:methyl coenzyme M reductase subunit C-like uncharacterized protein (methanogenesis marker protein 7)